MKQFLKMIFASCLGVILASVVVIFIFFAALGAAIQGVMSSFGGEDKSSTLTVPSESVLLLDLTGDLSDKPVDNPFTTLTGLFASDRTDEKQEYTLPEVLRAVDLARTDDRVKAIVLRLDQVSMGYAAAYELRSALEAFKASGKSILAYCGDFMGFGSYYVSTVADKLYASPEAMLPVMGLSSTTIFQKGLLAKLGVEMQVFKVGTYKGAVEPYMLDKLSPENRMQIQSFLDGLWSGMTTEMAKGRGIESSTYQTYADQGLFLAPIDRALGMGLVDSLVYNTDLDDVLAENIMGSGYDADDLDYVRVAHLLSAKTKNKGEKIAVVYAEGNIVDYIGDDNPLANRDNVIDTRLAQTIRDLADDDDIKAVVLRVNSPGGSARASELIAREVVNLKEQKPIVVSMGNLAASGGYYISSNASEIIAEPYTLTGSIGIFGVFPNATEAAKKLALTYDTVKTTEMADFGNLFRPMRPEEKAVMQRMIEQGYDKFLTRVSEGRGMTKEAVDAVGQGRVWLGQQALERGLVDKLGGLQVAIDEAARLAELDSYRVVEIDDRDNGSLWAKLFSADLRSMMSYFRMSAEEKVLYHAAQYLQQQTGIMARPDFSIEQITMDSNADSPIPALLKQ